MDGGYWTAAGRVNNLHADNRRSRMKRSMSRESHITHVAVATTTKDYIIARWRFREHATGLGVGLCFQSFDRGSAP